jgi:enoyl-CoA hydratase
MSDDVLIERADRVLVITLNRPDQRNAMTRAMGETIAAALDELDRSPELAVGVITGSGGNFCAGMDLKRFAAGELASVPGRGFGGLTEAPPRKPMIAAVEGYALAGGFELVLACDLTVASRSAVFGLPEVKRGLVARAGGLLRLPAQLPRPIALELILTGDPLPAERAAAFGLVNRLTAEGAALATARELAATIAANAPLAVAAAKQVVSQVASWPPDEWFERQRAIVEPVITSEDAREGARAFVERRPPVWRSR